MRIFTHPKLILDIKEINGTKYFKLIWKGIFNTVVFRDLVYKSIKSYKEELPKFNNTTTSKVLIVSDSTEVELIRKVDVEWLITVVHPILEEIGITHQAIIPPNAERISDLVDHYSAEKKYKNFSYQVFRNEEEGVSWYMDHVNKLP
ncbi:MAG: hypothetical protein ACI9XJ_001133 [Marivirga sp.]|jgi:hypothetical protein